MKNYQIYLSGEATNRFYTADDAEEAIESYIEDCTAEYRDNFGEDPDPEQIYQAGEITAEVTE